MNSTFDDNNNGSCSNPDWLIDYDFMMMDGDFSTSAVSFHHHNLPPPPPPPPPPPGSIIIDFSWASQSINYSSNVCEEINCSFEGSEVFKEIVSRKRLKSESCTATGPKACREKLRRDRLNERFMELSSVVEPGRSPRIEKTALLSDAIRMITQLRTEVQKLKESNEDMVQKIKDLKAEKNELRHEKNTLKAHKEKLEQQVKSLATQPGFLPQASIMGGAFAAAKAQGVDNKLMPIISYPGVAMWQFMQPAVVDTSQDHVLRPPVA